MEIKERIRNYFKMTEEEKDSILVEIVNIYIDVKENRFKNNVGIVELLQRDIKLFESEEEFETAQALNDILKAYYDIINNLGDDELQKIINELQNKDKNV